jgi:hypothetical protein
MSLKRALYLLLVVLVAGGSVFGAAVGGPWSIALQGGDGRSAAFLLHPLILFGLSASPPR